MENYDRTSRRRIARPALTLLAALAAAAATVMPTALVAQRSDAGSASVERRPAPAETLFVYGPGGPLPAMRDAAAAYGAARGVHVEVTGGPAPRWLEKARADADVIYSGSEHMMTDFVRLLGDSTPGRIDATTITPLYLRPAAILVRKGNPKGIRRFEDLLRPGTRVLVVQGAGQTGLWEDMAGRTGDIGTVRALRKNIGAFAPTSGDAKRIWTEDPGFDVWLIWNIWQVANPDLADLVPIAEPWRIYRDAGVALTERGRSRSIATGFVDYLLSAEGAKHFARWGWITAAPAPGRTRE
ncbi:MAG TPA: substrate-binding domain-containing protein [Gemmatimonadales bacterium]